MKIYLVGGAIRDKLLELPVKERDYVVVGATVADMLKLNYRQVGKEFPVFLHPKTNEEYALARMERKVKPGYQGFEFDTSPAVSLKDDLLRRDLTINAMAMDLDTQALIDPYHGQADIQHKILRHVSAAFSEDPVRILRIGRFYARYAYLGFHIADETLALMRQMVTSGEVNALVAERVWKELDRALGEKNPENFFAVLENINAMTILFPHLASDGAGMQALRAATTLSTDTEIRFAALLFNLPEDHTNKSDCRKILGDFCNRYRVPNAYRELAQLTALHHENALQAAHLSAEELLQLFTMLDIFRRETRFKKFLIACEAIAISQRRRINTNWLLACAEQARTIDVQAFIAKGFSGNELAAKLKQERQEKIEAWLLKH